MVGKALHILDEKIIYYFLQVLITSDVKSKKYYYSIANAPFTMLSYFITFFATRKL